MKVTLSRRIATSIHLTNLLITVSYRPCRISRQRSLAVKRSMPHADPALSKFAGLRHATSTMPPAPPMPPAGRPMPFSAMRIRFQRHASDLLEALDEGQDFWVAEVAGAVAGIMTLQPHFIDKLFIAPHQARPGPRHRGSWRKAKSFFPDHLELHCAQQNYPACRFYEREQFRPVHCAASTTQSASPRSSIAGTAPSSIRRRSGAAARGRFPGRCRAGSWRPVRAR